MFIPASAIARLVASVVKEAPRWAKEVRSAANEYNDRQREKYDQESTRARAEFEKNLRLSREETLRKMQRYMAPEHLANYMEDWDTDARQKLREFEKQSAEERRRRYGV